VLLTDISYVIYWAYCVVLQLTAQIAFVRLCWRSRVAASELDLQATLTLVAFGYFQGKRESREKCKLGKNQDV
jgi:hypothetical protein